MSVSQTPGLATIPRPWHMPLVASVGLVLMVIAVFYPTAADMVSIWWRSETFAHGFLIVPISGYLIWRQAEYLKKLEPRATWMGLPAILMASLLWWVAEVSGTAVIAQFAFTALIPLVVLTMLGPQVAQRLWFPLAYLLFAVPAGEGLIQPMMDFTAVFTVKAIELTGIPVYWEGRYIAIPKGNFEVAEACSGVRYLIASVALGALYAHLTYRSLWRQAAFLLLAALVPIIANGIRAYGIVMIAHLSDMQLAVGADHLIYGWLFFGVVMFILFGVGSIWQEDTESELAEGPASGTRMPGRELSLAMMVPLTLLAFIAGPVLNQVMSQSGESRPISLGPVQPQDGWQLSATSPVNWEPRFIGAADEQRLTLEKGDHRVELYMAVYGDQRQGAELLNFSNRFYNPDRWLRLGERGHFYATEQGDMDFNEVHVQRSGARGVIWHVYEIAGIQTTNPVLAKVLEAWNRLALRRPSRILAIYADYDLRVEEARDLLVGFLNGNRAMIEQAFEQADTGGS